MDTNGLPPQPEGVSTNEMGIVPVGEAFETGIVPVAGARMSQNIAMWLGFAACVLAGLLAPSTTIASSALAGYSILLLCVTHGTRTAAAGTGVACVAAVLASLFVSAQIIPSAVLTIVVAAAIGAGLGTGKLNSNMACVVCVVAALAYLGIDSAIAALAGTDLYSLMVSQVDAMISALAEDASALGSSAELVRTVASFIWPSSYTLNAIVGVVSAALGARIARRGLGPLAPKALTFTVFDVPIWVAGALLASIVAFAIAQAIPGSDVLLTIAINVALAVRFAFGISGTAVAAFYLRRRGVGLLATLVVCGVLVFIDMQFFVMAIVGLIDFWANFRHLPRGVQPAPATV